MRPVVAYRRLLVSALVLSLVSGAASAEAATTGFSVSGSGWGDGVGLSQYGAKAMAADGATYEQILGRYFTGAGVGHVTTVGPGSFGFSDLMPLWVGLMQNSGRVSFTVAPGSAQLCFDGSVGCVVTTRTDTNYRFGPDETGSCVFSRILASGVSSRIGPSGPCDASVRPMSDLTTINLPFKARSYRHGTLRFRPAPSSSGIHTSYQIGVTDYMKGISEVPESWPRAAIEAQVVVSRSFAVWTALQRGSPESFTAQRKADCYCNLRDDASDQIFRGWTGESSHPEWVSAVASTGQDVLTHGGGVALGLHSSSSGGATENYADVFGGVGYPYLTTVDDSPAFSDSAQDPHVSWKAGYSQANLAATYGFSWVFDAEVVDRNPSGSARTIRIAGIVNGKPEELIVTAVEFRAALSLRSTTFEITTTPSFSDVQTDHPFAGEILGLHELGVTVGCTAMNFCPDQDVTRAEMAAFLVRALDLTMTGEEDPFRDDDGHALEVQIAVLHGNGITTGCSILRYCPEQGVTRAEMAAFLVRAFNLPPAEGANQFTDVEDHFFSSEIAVLGASGITTGCTATKFCPDRLLTRAEMAAFLVRALA